MYLHQQQHAFPDILFSHVYLLSFLLLKHYVVE